MIKALKLFGVVDASYGKEEYCGFVMYDKAGKLIAAQDFYKNEKVLSMTEEEVRLKYTFQEKEAENYEEMGRKHGFYILPARSDLYLSEKLLELQPYYKKMIGLVLTCTAFGKPVWYTYDVHREDPEENLPDRNITYPPPYRIIYPILVPALNEKEIREYLQDERLLLALWGLDLNNHETWFQKSYWLDNYLYDPRLASRIY